ncbi:MAG: glycosyltransferase family 2 protein [Candidatus Acidiferrales bacterium]
MNNTVSVVILTHNNKDLLRKSLSHALRLQWPDIEVIVVDNVSSDGTPEMVQQEFGGAVRLIRRTVDSITAGRNEGFRSAKGEFILSIDDDMIFNDVHAIRKAVAIFRQCPDVGVLTFRIADLEAPDEPQRQHWWHPIPIDMGKNRLFYTNFISEGAIFARASVIRATGGYDDEFFGFFEGVDWAFRLIRDGIKILYCPTISCVELRVRRIIDQHSKSARNYWILRNKLWTVWKHYPLGRAIWYSAPRVALAAYQSCRYGWIKIFLRALKDGVFAPHAIRAQRRPLDREIWKKVQEIQQGQFCAVETTHDVHADTRAEAEEDSGSEMEVARTTGGSRSRGGTQTERSEAGIWSEAKGRRFQTPADIRPGAEEQTGEFHRAGKPDDDDAGWLLTAVCESNPDGRSTG